MKNVLKDSKLFVQVGGVVLDATLDTASEVISYYPCYDAYLTATDVLKQSLLAIYIEANHGDLPETTVKDSWLRVSLMAAIKNFIFNSEPGATEVRALVQKTAKGFVDSLKDATAKSWSALLFGNPLV